MTDPALDDERDAEDDEWPRRVRRSVGIDRNYAGGEQGSRLITFSKSRRWLAPSDVMGEAAEEDEFARSCQVIIDRTELRLPRATGRFPGGTALADAIETLADEWVAMRRFVPPELLAYDDAGTMLAVKSSVVTGTAQEMTMAANVAGPAVPLGAEPLRPEPKSRKMRRKRNP